MKIKVIAFLFLLWLLICGQTSCPPDDPANTNLVAEGDAESGLDCWTFEDRLGESLFSADCKNYPYQGSCSFRVDRGASEDCQDIVLFQSLEQSLSGAAECTVTLVTRGTPSGFLVLQLIRDGDPYDNLGLLEFPSVSQDWQRFEYIFTVVPGESHDGRLAISFGCPDSPTTTFWLDTITLNCQTR